MTTVNTAELSASPQPPADFDDAKAEAFADRFVDAINAGGLMLLASVGHRTGLFDAMDGLGWATSQQIADAADLQERYVREWLGGMVTGRVVDYRPEDRTYQLPAEHAASLTRRVSPENLAVTAQWLAVLGYVESDVVDKFHNGGGVHYETYHRFHETMAEESSQTVVAGLEQHILPLSPRLQERLESGVDVLEIGSGSGRALTHLAGLFPNSRFTGYDLCNEAVAFAKRSAREAGVNNIEFEVRDVNTLDAPEQYDVALAFDVVHDTREPDTVLANVRDALRPGGQFLVQDIAGSSYLERNLDHMLGTFTYTISTMHCMTVSLAQDGAGLGTMWGEELAEQMFNDAGFANLKKYKLPHDIINAYYVMDKV